MGDGKKFPQAHRTRSFVLTSPRPSPPLILSSFSLVVAMTATEIWLTYHQTSRAGRPSTAQLIDLASHGHKLTDLEDVLDHIFAEGYVESKFRPVSYWEKTNGEKVKGGLCVEDLLQQGVGKCEETALRLIIGKSHSLTPSTSTRADVASSGPPTRRLVQLPLHQCLRHDAHRKPTRQARGPARHL